MQSKSAIPQWWTTDLIAALVANDIGCNNDY